MLAIRPLRSADAPAIAALGAVAYPHSFSLSAGDIEETLDDLRPEENLCFGLFSGPDLIGYLLCWLDTTQVEERGDEPVLLLDDIVVVGAARNHLFQLLRALRAGIVERGLTALAIEGTHREQAEQLFNSHPRLVALLGYRQAATHHYFGEREQETLCWARYEPVQ